MNDGVGGRGKIRLEGEEKDKRWVNGRRDDEVLRKGNTLSRLNGAKR